jgi:pimeloyl-ACP methyl ester carboxylesterase
MGREQGAVTDGGAAETRRTLRGLDVCTLEWGAPRDASDVPVVLVHGWADHAGTWAEVAPRLGRWCVAPDLRGHGHSGWCGLSETYHVAEYVADLDALVTALGGRAHVVGHSLGGTVVTLWAGARPERALSVTVVDGLGLPDAGEGAVTRMREFLDGVAAGPPAHRPFGVVDEAAGRLRAAHPFLASSEAAALAERGTVAREERRVWAWDPRHRLRSPTPYRQDVHARFLASITAQVLLVRPARSPFTVEDFERLRAAMPRARVREVPDAGHMVQLEAPEVVAAAVSEAIAHADPA